MTYGCGVGRVYQLISTKLLQLDIPKPARPHHHEQEIAERSRRGLLPNRCSRLRVRVSDAVPSIIASATVLLVLSGLTGCAGFALNPKDRAAQQQRLKTELTRQEAVNQELVSRNASIQLQLLEQQATADELSRRLDEAVREVVRTKAKLRSLESKAEAVSTLAEGEIALKTLQTQHGSAGKDANIRQAEERLKASSVELRKENYGGALYLATQAKVLIDGGLQRSRLREREPTLDGEVSFSTPIALRVIASARIRERPSLESAILYTLPDQSEVVGHSSHKDRWVHIVSQDGRRGWVYYSLITQR